MFHLKLTNPIASSNTRLPCGAFRILSNTLRRTCQVLRILLRYLFWSFPFNASLVKIYPAHLRGTHAHQKEVHSSQTIILSATCPRTCPLEKEEVVQQILGPNNETPSSPDCTRSHKSKIL